MGESETTGTPTAADRAFDPTTQSAPSEAPSGPSAATQPTPNQDHISSAPWAESLAQRFPDEGVRTQVDSYLRDTVQPYVTQYEQAHGQAAQILDTLLGDDPQEALNTYLAVTEAAYGPEVALNVANHLVEALGINDNAPAANGTPAAEDTTVPPPELDQYLASLPPEVRAVVESQIHSDEDAQWDNMLKTQIYPRDWTTAAQDGALFSQYVANSDTLEDAFQAWDASMKPLIEKSPELFGLQPGGAQATDDGGATAAAQAAAAASAAVDNGAPQVLGSSSIPGTTTPPTVPAHTSLDEAVSLFLNDLQASSSDSSRGF